MRLLVTRPKEDAARTAAQLTALGHTVVIQPVLEVVFAPPPEALAKPAAILFTSGNAVRAVATWPEMGRWRDIPVFAAGPATAELAAAAGFVAVRQGRGDAASLAEAVAAALSPKNGPLLYPAARDRSGGLEQRLAEHGFRVAAIEAYRAEAVAELGSDARSALAAGTIEGVLVYSRRTAGAFLSLAAKAGLGAAIRAPEYFALSEEVAEPLRQHGVRVQVARHPDETSLLALLPAAG